MGNLSINIMIPNQNIYNNILNCKKYNGSICKICNKGYEGPNCKQVSITNCINQRENICYKCKKYYTLKKNKCYAPPSTTDINCKDTNNKCLDFVKKGKCRKYKNIAKLVCKKSCNYCAADLKQLIYYNKIKYIKDKKHKLKKIY